VRTGAADKGLVEEAVNLSCCSKMDHNR